MNNKGLCYDVIGKIIEYIELKDVPNYMVLDKQIYKNFCEGYYKIYDRVVLEFYRSIKKDDVPYDKTINFITCASISGRWKRLTYTNEYYFGYHMPNITYIILNLSRGEFWEYSKKTFDFSECYNLELITIYNYKSKIYDHNIKYKDNKSIVELDLQSCSKTRSTYYLADDRKTCTLTFIGYNYYAIKIEVYHDVQRHEELID
uniref:Uncharacterized protein n=1 Tax=Mimivirus LCMiAC01 TaxID=2506608 RepID=A0A481Z0R8_9VIRU|nr:MAG: hypothetical protein LCMiAC01_04430 [Mimivirus LCMiAC01]